MRTVFLLALLLSPAAHAASAGSPSDEDASRWLDWVDDSETPGPTAALKTEEGSSPGQLERVFAGSQLSLKASAGSSSTLDQNLSATVSLFSLVDTNLWYAFNHPGSNLLARRFGGGVAVRPGRRTRLAFDYEHALPENQYGANLFWLSWSANVAPAKLATRLGASLGRMNFTDNSSVPLVNQTALRIALTQDATARLSFSGSYTYYSDPHGPVEAADKIRLLQLAISDRALNVDLEKPKTFEADLNGRYLLDESDDLLFDFSVLRYFAGPDATPENPIYTPGLTFTRLFGRHIAIDVSASLLLESGLPANPSFGLQTTFSL